VDHCHLHPQMMNPAHSPLKFKNKTMM
jgi:hypothetical protein